MFAAERTLLRRPGLRLGGAVADEVRTARLAGAVVCGLGFRARLNPRLGDRKQRLTCADGVTGVRMEADDASGVRAGEFDDGLRGLDLDDHLIDVDLIADLDLPGDQLRLGEAFAEVGKDEFARTRIQISTHHNSQSQDSSASSTRSTVGK